MPTYVNFFPPRLRAALMATRADRSKMSSNTSGVWTIACGPSCGARMGPCTPTWNATAWFGDIISTRRVAHWTTNARSQQTTLAFTAAGDGKTKILTDNLFIRWRLRVRVCVCVCSATTNAMTYLKCLHLWFVLYAMAGPLFNFYASSWSWHFIPLQTGIGKWKTKCPVTASCVRLLHICSVGYTFYVFPCSSIYAKILVTKMCL